MRKPEAAPPDKGGSPVELSVVVVNWNTRDLLAQCLGSIQAYPPGVPYEVWVVDNASSDGSAAVVRERFPWVRLIENEENLGFAAANNQGIRASRGRYVLILNPDTVVHSGALDVLVDFMGSHPAAGAAGARLLNADGSLQITCGPRQTLLTEAWKLWHLDRLWRLGTYDMESWDVTTPREVDIVKGACLIAPRSLLYQVGLLDESLFLYGEELLLCGQIQDAGFAIYWVPAAVVTHFGRASTDQIAEEAFLEHYVSKQHYFRSRHGKVAGLAFTFVLLLTALLRAPLGLLAYLRKPAGRGEWRAIARSYRRLAAAILSGRFKSVRSR